MEKYTNKDKVLKKLKELKPHYEKEGFILLGIFGSFARDDVTQESDIDILYDLEDKKFLSLYPGFEAFSKLTQLKKELKDIFSRDIDLATIDNNSRVFQKFTLKDAIYV